eukprot:jgi/Bigna1/82298/fgenesh1_pg.90_\
MVMTKQAQNNELFGVVEVKLRLSSHRTIKWTSENRIAFQGPQSRQNKSPIPEASHRLQGCANPTIFPSSSDSHKRMKRGTLPQKSLNTPRRGNGRRVRRKTDAGVKPPSDNDDQTAKRIFNYAHCRDWNKVIDFFREKRCPIDINHTDLKGRTILHHAVKSGVQHVEQLLKLKADVNAADECGKTPMYYLASHKEVSLLMKANADLNHKDNHRRTPLEHIAQANYDRILIVQQILQHLKQPPKKLVENALDLAKRQRNVDITDLLQNYLKEGKLSVNIESNKRVRIRRRIIAGNQKPQLDEELIIESKNNNFKPKKGHVNWFKFSGHDWWPGQLLHRSEIPEKMMRTKQRGKMCVKWILATDEKEYNWVDKRHVCPWYTGPPSTDCCEDQKVLLKANTLNAEAKQADVEELKEMDDEVQADDGKAKKKDNNNVKEEFDSETEGETSSDEEGFVSEMRPEPEDVEAATHDQRETRYGQALKVDHQRQQPAHLGADEKKPELGSAFMREVRLKEREAAVKKKEAEIEVKKARLTEKLKEEKQALKKEKQALKQEKNNLQALKRQLEEQQNALEVKRKDFEKEKAGLKARMYKFFTSI